MPQRNKAMSGGLPAIISDLLDPRVPLIRQSLLYQARWVLADMARPGVWHGWRQPVAALLAVANLVHGFDLDISSTESLKNAASTAIYGQMHLYQGNASGAIPGKLPGTWWEGGALFMAAIEYWHETGDTTYNNEVSVGMQWQAGDGDYMPSNWSSYLGNDDQMFWGLAAMTATELQYPAYGTYSWLSLAQGVFNTQVARWDPTTCGGGLRWQIWAYEAGYNLKNAISNGGLFQLAARLAYYTHNATYAEWAEKIFDWCASTPLLSTETWNVADSVEVGNNCTTQGNNQWSYNYGTFISGAAYMYNYTNGTEKWEKAVNGLLGVTLNTFFPTQYGGNIMSEILCEPTEICNANEILFKGLTAAWLAFTSVLVPSTYDQILPKLQGSAEAAAASCSGNNNNSCGVRWYTKAWDGWTGIEEQISGTNIFVANLVAANRTRPVTATTGGNSTSDPTAGQDDHSTSTQLAAITTGDKVGAGFLTAGFVTSWIGLLVWMVIGT
ncbi:CAZyme family GH76 [Paecilomyces variotii]|nr:CAZyme family GH76 [Paecilomyces variotii]